MSRPPKIGGSTDLRIILTLLLPLLLPPVLFTSVLDVARMMIFRSTLGFPGLGVQPPTPTIRQHHHWPARKYLLNAWWIATHAGPFSRPDAHQHINLMSASLERARSTIHGGSA